MKRLITLILLAAFIAQPADARRRETPEEAAKKMRSYSGWEIGASGRVNFIFYELQRMKIASEDLVSAYRIPKKQLVGGQITFNAGRFLDNHWKIGIETGIQIQYNGPVVPIYATAHYYYGKRKNCLFNYLNAGTNILFEHGPRMGGTFGAGGGYRLRVKDSDMNIDLMIGYQLSMLSPRPVVNGNFAFDRKDISYKALNQMAYFGIGVTF